jgi:hypothetical protein
VLFGSIIGPVLLSNVFVVFFICILVCWNFDIHSDSLLSIINVQLSIQIFQSSKPIFFVSCYP